VWQTDRQTDRQTNRRPDDGKDARSILLSRVKNEGNLHCPADKFFIIVFFSNICCSFSVAKTAIIANGPIVQFNRQCPSTVPRRFAPRSGHSKFQSLCRQSATFLALPNISTERCINYQSWIMSLLAKYEILWCSKLTTLPKFYRLIFPKQISGYNFYLIWLTKTSTDVVVIPRLHNQANIEQTFSKCIQNTRARRVL